MFLPHLKAYTVKGWIQLTEVLDPELIDAIELGLSSDTDMVKDIEELESYVFVTNSDAHSLGKIAREYQKILLEEPSFNELAKALQEKGESKVTSQLWFEPLIGKVSSNRLFRMFTSGIKG